MRKWFNRTFANLYFSKKEFNGIVVLSIIILLVFISPWVHRSFFLKPYPIDTRSFDKEIDDFYTQTPENDSRNTPYLKNPATKSIHKKDISLFTFNPNTATLSDWQNLGLSIKQAQSIEHYKAKGGRFYKKEDLAKMYCLSTKQYKQLEPYINIPTLTKKGALSEAKPITKPNISIVELNACDSIGLLNIKGIGPSFASRILKFKKKFGGFYQKEQLKEVYGIDSAKYVSLEPYVSVNAQLVQRTNINTAKFDDLKRYYPYLSYKQMNAIINYRTQHGTFKSIDELNNIILLDSKTIQKIKPYLSL